MKSKFVILIFALVFILSLSGCTSSPKVVLDSDTVVMKVGDYVITGSEYKYWVLQIKSSYEDTYGSSFWSKKDGKELGRQVIEYINEYLIERYTILSMADKAGFKLEESKIEELEAAYKAEISSVKDLNSYLAEFYMTEELYYRICYLEEQIINDYLAYLKSSEDGIEISEEELDQYISEQGYMTVFQIMIKNDSEDNVSENQALAEDIKRRASAGEDFEALSKQYNESSLSQLTISVKDTNYAEYFVEGVKDLKVGEVGKVLEYKTDFQSWYLVVKRVENDIDSIRDEIKENLIEELVQKESEALKTSYCDGFENITVKDVVW